MNIRKIAILGPTASGKTALALNLAKKYNGVILSLDSLSLYKEIDIASAKPTLKERGNVPHFGIDVLFPNEAFNVTLFFDLYNKAYSYASRHNHLLIIVGGTSFYLKAMLEGLSLKPEISPLTKLRVKRVLENIKNAQALTSSLDDAFVKKTEKFDRYRLEKWLELYFETGEIPSLYQLKKKQPPIIDFLMLFEVLVERASLRERIAKRTKSMLEAGLVDEVKRLKLNYGVEHSCMKAIGIKETLEYLEGKIDIKTLEELINIHTSQLAKRQQTFNKTQFSKPPIQAPIEALDKIIEAYI